MQWQTYVRRILLGGILFFLFYYIVFRRRSAQVFLNASHVQEYNDHQKKLNTTHLQRIPRIIHQTWKTRDVPLRWNETVATVHQHNADKFEYRLWTDDDMHKFVREKEPYFYEHTFLTYPYNIQRIDAFRYVILYHLGGIYIDMDNGCRQSFDSLFNILELLDAQSTNLAAFPRTSPVGISNGFMISTKNHPLFQILISRLSLFNHNYLIDYLTVMLTAGPIYLSINEFYFDKSSTQSSVRILDEIVYSSIYTWHTPGNSWHGPDAKFILWFYHSVRTAPAGYFYRRMLIIAVIVLFLLYQRRRRRRRRQTENLKIKSMVDHII